jgi:hypothetical protein
MVAGDMASRALFTSSVSWPKCSLYLGSHKDKMALSLLEQGRFAVSHICS